MKFQDYFNARTCVVYLMKNIAETTVSVILQMSSKKVKDLSTLCNKINKVTSYSSLMSFAVIMCLFITNVKQAVSLKEK